MTASEAAQGSPGRKTASFGPGCRVRRRGEFDVIYREGVRFSGRLVGMVGRANGLAGARLGVSVGRRVGNAVVRNGWKRRLRELFRRQAGLRARGLDVVISVRAVGPAPDPDTLRLEIDRGFAFLLRRVRVP